MSIAAALGIYFVTWWIVWFAVLPWGVRGQHEAETFERGTDPGAPQQPLLFMKVVATSVVSAIVLAIIYVIWTFGLIPFERIPLPFQLPSR
jgi:predicted secreted protein